MRMLRSEVKERPCEAFASPSHSSPVPGGFRFHVGSGNPFRTSTFLLSPQLLFFLLSSASHTSSVKLCRHPALYQIPSTGKTQGPKSFYSPSNPTIPASIPTPTPQTPISGPTIAAAPVALALADAVFVDPAFDAIVAVAEVIPDFAVAPVIAVPVVAAVMPDRAVETPLISELAAFSSAEAEASAAERALGSAVPTNDAAELITPVADRCQHIIEPAR